jgi:hypothetical protein
LKDIGTYFEEEESLYREKEEKKSILRNANKLKISLHMWRIRAKFHSLGLLRLFLEN